METSALAIAYTEDSEYGGINSGTNDVHLSEIGVHGLDIVDAHGDEREAGRIDQHVEYGSLIVAFRPKFPPICARNCRASPTMAANISHRDFSYRQFIHLICSRVIPKMMALIDTKRKQVNCRRNKLSISLFFYIWHLSRPAFHSLCPWGVNPLQKYKYFFKTNNLLPAFCVMFFRLPS